MLKASQSDNSQKLPDLFSNGFIETCPTSDKLMYLSQDSTSSQYCLTLIAEIENAVAKFISTSIEDIG
jgi:hypothetical protein